MNRIIFAGRTREWCDALHQDPPEGAVVEFRHQESLTFPSGRGMLTVLDSETFLSMEPFAQKMSYSFSVVIILQTGLTQEEVHKLESSTLACHHLVSGPTGGELQNFRQLLSLVFRVQTMERRLENYITDSFRDIVDTHLLHQQKKQIEELNKQLEQLSRTDALTHLLNRRALMEAFELEKKRALRTRWRLDHEADSSNEARPAGSLTQHIGNFSCLMVDIDHFKAVNDTYGHLSGDEVLRRFGELIQNQTGLRENDIVGRYGGEEFIILLPDTNAENALVPAERLRQGVKELKFTSPEGKSFQVTISIGVAEFLPEELDIAEMINRADQALYKAKTSGRDQVCVYK